ncbi:MAG: hypothetical protein IMF11_12480 [Proteobacteria bacterium]|nr:hypothetical protein [Pseudomonadota bacterium]
MTEKEKALIQDYKHTFGTDAGKRVYADLMHQCYMDSPAHHVDNVNKTFILGGKRAIGLHIKSQRETDLSNVKIEVITEEKQPIEMKK